MHPEIATRGHQSAAIPYRIVDGELQVMVITSRKRKRWIIPKGIVESYMSPADSAAKEAYEEAGVLGNVFAESIGAYEEKKWGQMQWVQTFPFQVHTQLEVWPEGHFRKRKWCGWQEAVARLHKPGMQQVVGKLPTFLKTRLLWTNWNSSLY